MRHHQPARGGGSGQCRGHLSAHLSAAQASYEELGYPGSYFMIACRRDRSPDRHTRAARTAAARTAQVLYRFQDAGWSPFHRQKLLLRIGPAHAQTVKQKLGELRALIATNPADTKE